MTAIKLNQDPTFPMEDFWSPLWSSAGFFPGFQTVSNSYLRRLRRHEERTQLGLQFSFGPQQNLRKKSEEAAAILSYESGSMLEQLVIDGEVSPVSTGSA